MRTRRPTPSCPSSSLLSHLLPHAPPRSRLFTRAACLVLALGACTQPGKPETVLAAKSRQAATASPTLTSITIDGKFADWQQVLLNPLQVSIDGNGINGSGCYPTDTDRDCESYTPQRDINEFVWTYDQQVISTRLFRPTSNATLTYSFVMDVNANGVAEASDRVLQVTWKSGGPALDVQLFAYVPVAPAGDPMACPDAASCPSLTNPHAAIGFVDGYTMPGTTGALLWTPPAPEPACAGSGPGTECGGDGVGHSFEVAVPWAQLGVAPGSPIMWHVASSTTAQFNQAKDNVGGPDGRIGTFGVFGVDFRPDHFGTTASPGAVDYCHDIENLGNFPDSYDVLGVSSTGASVAYYEDSGDCTAGRLLGIDATGNGSFADPGDSIAPGADVSGNGFPDTGRLAAGSIFKLLLRVSFPAGKSGVTDQLVASARSEARPGQATDTATDFTRLGDVTVIPDFARSGTPGAVVDFGPHSVHNNQTTTDVVSLNVTSGHGWRVALYQDASGAPGTLVATDSNGDGTWDGTTPTVALAAGGSASYWLRVTIPPGASIGAVDGVTFFATSTTKPTSSGSAHDTLTVRTGLSISPSYAAPSNNLIGVPGTAVYLPHLVVNATNAALTVALTQTGTLAAGYSIRWWTDPNGDGSIADGAPITGSFTLPAFGGSANIVTEIDVPSSGTPASTAAATTVSGGSLSATAEDDVAVGYLQTFTDALLTRQARAFESCATVYALGSGLTPLASTNYQLRYLDPSGAVVSSANLPTNDVGQGAGSYTQAAADATGGWRVSVLSGSTLVSDLQPVTMERSGSVLVGTAGTIAEGQPLNVLAQLTNTQGRTTVTASSVLFELVDPLGAVAATGSVGGLDVANAATITVYQLLLAPTGGAAGTYTVRATWKSSCGGVIAVGTTTAARPPPAPTLLSPANGQSVGTLTPALSGTALAGATVTVTVDGAWTGTGTGPNFTVTATSLTQGAHTWSATQTVSGVTGPSSAAFTFIVDTVAPLAPVLRAPVSGTVSNATTPTVSGTAEAGSAVKVYASGTLVGTVTASATGAFSYTLTAAQALGAGTVLLTATATDAAGNTSPPSAAVQVDIDLTPPAAPVILAPANGSTTASLTPTVAGTAEAQSTVVVRVDGQVVGTVTTSSTGTFSYRLTAAQALTSGGHSATAVATDVAGNASAPSLPSAFTVNPSATSVVVVLVPADGSFLATGTPTISGTTAPGTSVQVKLDGVVKGTVTASAGGAWTYTLTAAQALTQGLHAASAQGYDLGNNAYPPSNVDTFTVDLTAPLAPVLTAPANGAFTQGQPTVSGTAEPGTQVTVLIDGVALATVTAGSNGVFTSTLTVAQALAEGSHGASARATDAAGNVSPLAATHTFTVDVTAPISPVLVAPASGALVDTARPTLSGTAEANSLVAVRVDGVLLGTVKASVAGTFSVTPSATQALREGSHAVTLTATDAAGNVSAPSVPSAFIVDLTAPVAPVVTAPQSGAFLSTATPTVSGTAEPSSTVTVRVDGRVVGTALTTSGGTFSVTLGAPLSDGLHVAAAVATDVAGNGSPSSAPVSFTVDTVAPPAPTLLAPATGAVLAINLPTFAGNAEARSTVTLFIDGAAMGAVAADGQANFAVAPTSLLADGPHTVTATARDSAGNTSPASAPVSFVVDTLPPAIPVVLAPVDGAALNTATPVVSGTGEPGTQVSLLVDGVLVGAVTVASDGTFSFTLGSPQPLGEGTHGLVAVASDAAGNVSPPSAPIGFLVDLTPPPPPIVTVPSPGATLASGTPTISGSAEPGASVRVFVDGNELGRVTAGPAGTFGYTLTTSQVLADGSHVTVADARDAAGNQSLTSVVVGFSVDTTPPGAPVLTNPIANTEVSPSLTVLGSAEPSSLVTVLLDGQSVGTVTTTSGGTFGLPMGTPLSMGRHVVSAYATDPVGNVGPDANPVPVSVSEPPVVGGGSLPWPGGLDGKDGLTASTAVLHGDPLPEPNAGDQAPIVAKAGCGCDSGSADFPALVGLFFVVLARFRRVARAS